MSSSCERRRCAIVAALFVLAVLAGCGSADSNPLDNPDTVNNSGGVSGQRLCYAYYQQCVNPIFLKLLAGNTCAAAGCHEKYNGTGGAFSVDPKAVGLDFTSLVVTPELIKASEMYENYISAVGETIPGSPFGSRLLLKPLVFNVTHGGGLIFASAQDADARIFSYWINSPALQGNDEFSSECDGMFNKDPPSDPDDYRTWTCNSD